MLEAPHHVHSRASQATPDSLQFCLAAGNWPEPLIPGAVVCRIVYRTTSGNHIARNRSVAIPILLRSKG
jgi:hypothetical protein